MLYIAKFHLPCYNIHITEGDRLNPQKNSDCELTQEMKRRSGGTFTISVLYPVLYRLEEHGYIEVARSELVDGRTRRYYAINEAGRACLSETLADYQMISEIFGNVMKRGGDNEL